MRTGNFLLDSFVRFVVLLFFDSAVLLGISFCPVFSDFALPERRYRSTFFFFFFSYNFAIVLLHRFLFLQEGQQAAPVYEPAVQVAPPVLPRNSAPTRPPSSGTGDEVWVRLNNASYAEGLYQHFTRSSYNGA